MRDILTPLPEGVAPDLDAAEVWTASGMRDLTGPADRPGLDPPSRLVPALERTAADLARASGSLGRAVRVDPLALLAARVGEPGRRRQGTTSCGGGSRLLEARDGWLAVCLARPDDAELVPAWLVGRADPAVAARDPWAAIAEACRSSTAAELLEAAAGLGLPLARVGERAPTAGLQLGGVQARRLGTRPAVTSLADLRVIDLSALWAGPLCGALLAAGGAQVTKVESRSRPDAARVGSPDLFTDLNGSKRLEVLDFTSEAGRARLRELVTTADVVIEGSRPRALAQLGIDAEALLASADGPRLWISITGFGRTSADRVAFGDVAAAAGGLVAWHEGTPLFCGDAIADPLSGLAAAVAALDHLPREGAWLLDVAMADVSASVADPPAQSERATTSGGGSGSRRPVATALLLRDVEVKGRRTSVLLSEGRITALGDSLDPALAATEIDGGGGALLPGLHDHHLHLAATAALARSVVVGPPDVRNADDLRRVLGEAARTTPPGRWIRAVGYHHSVAGDLDRVALDALVADRPLRVQDRSGARWTVNSMGAAALGLDLAAPPGIERGADGPTGRLHRLDDWLRERLPDDGPPDFARLGRRLAAAGITGVTDTTPYRSAQGFDLLAAAAGSGALPQRVVVTGGIDLLGVTPPPPLEAGPVKLLIDDGSLPTLDDLTGWIAAAHEGGRPVAVHCVTRVALTLLLAALADAGSRPGDRIEHGAVIAPEHLAALRDFGLTVVTQPAFVAERGDRYLAEVDPDDVDHLYRCGSLLAAGIPVAASSDAPYADADPWRSMAAAARRTTPSGRVLGPDEAISPATALGLYLGDPHDPGGPPRRVRPGETADLCLLRVPLTEALQAPSAALVHLTVVGGRICHDADASPAG